MSQIKTVLTEPLFSKNLIAVQILGICSALAVTTSLQVTPVMCLALTSVTALSNTGIALIRNHSEQHPYYRTDDHHCLLVIGRPGTESLGEISKQLSVFVGLIIPTVS